MPRSGARKSCATEKANASRRALAAWRSAVRSRTCRSRSAAYRRSGVRSRVIFDAPMMVPFESRIGEIVSETSKRRPSLATRTVSKFVIWSPRRIRSWVSSSSCARSFGTMIRIDRPTASSAEYPNRRSAAGFQAVMMPSRSLPMIGSFDHSTIDASRWRSPVWASRRLVGPAGTEGSATMSLRGSVRRVLSKGVPHAGCNIRLSPTAQSFRAVQSRIRHKSKAVEAIHPQAQVSHG